MRLEERPDEVSTKKRKNNDEGNSSNNSQRKARRRGGNFEVEERFSIAQANSTYKLDLILYTVAISDQNSSRKSEFTDGLKTFLRQTGKLNPLIKGQPVIRCLTKCFNGNKNERGSCS